MASQDDAQADSLREDELRSALANQYCRFVVHHFDDAATDAASVAELSMAFASENDADEDQVALRLHHVALPKLSAAGVVDYDSGTRTANYLADASLGDQLHLGESDSEYAVAVQ